MNQGSHDQPFVSPQKRISELTLKALLLGAVLAAVMCAANTYLGLYAGMTVSASIPAAVVSMGILRGLLKRGTILENNIVQTIASAGESLAAGIIFTVPALVITGVWSGFNFWTVTFIAILGGTLGIAFMIPLRRTLIVEEKELVYPEGVACAEVLEVGEKGGSGIGLIFSALGIGAVFKFLVSGFSIIKGTVEGAFRWGKTAFYLGSDMSPALLGVGFIVGFNISLLVFIGGAIGWIVGIPLFGIFKGTISNGSPLDWAWEIWNSQIRYMGVGTMVIGGIWAIIKVRKGISQGLKEAFSGIRGVGGERILLRTEEDLPTSQIVIVSLSTIIAIFFLYSYLTGSSNIGIVSGGAMVISAFFFVAVSSYIVGLVGSSNNPVSGMTICTVLLASGLLLLFGMTGKNGILASLGVAGIVCCAACTAGDVSQDLKTGHLLGATPRKQQLAQLVGVGASAFVIAPILTVLNSAYGIGTSSPTSLKAPQATLFASIVRAMFTEKGLPWLMLGLGIVIGIILILTDEILRAKGTGFRAYVMPVAVGIYLPLSLSVPILIGGILSLAVKRISFSQGERVAKEANHRGVLLSSGLIAGEAIMGIIIAALIVGGKEIILGIITAIAALIVGVEIILIPVITAIVPLIVGRVELPIKVWESDLLSLLLLACIIGLMVYKALRSRGNS